MTRIGALGAVLASLVLASPVFAQNGGAGGGGSLTIQNQVGNTGNANGTSALTNGSGNNTNQNTNQNYTGVNYSGYLGYTGDPSANINLGSNTVTNVNFLQLPGIIGPPGNFSQPYKPDVWLNGAGVIRPNRLTYAQAEDCASGYGWWGVDNEYVGKNTGKRARAIDLVYPAWDQVKPTTDISAYLGISTVQADEKPWLPAICKAAMGVMDAGADFGVVEFVVKPKNKFKGLGVGSSVGASGVPNAVSSGPYAIAGLGGFGIGWSSQETVGRVMVQLTGLTKSLAAAAINPRGAALPVVAASDVTRPVIVVPDKEPIKLPDGRGEPPQYGGSGVTPKPPTPIEPSGRKVTLPPAASTKPDPVIPQAAIPQAGRGSDFGSR